MKKLFLIIIFCLSLTSFVGCGGEGVGGNSKESEKEKIVEPPKVLKYGVDIDGYTLESNDIAMGQTMGALLGKYGISAYTVDKLDRAAKEIFPLKKIRGGNRYTMFLKSDSLGTQRLDYMAYERDNVDYVLFGFVNDSITITIGSKPTREVRLKKSAVINSSLWGAVMEAELPYVLAAQMEDVYQWTIDFFGIQKGDSFTVIYDEKFVEDTISVGVGQIWGAKFNHGDKEYYAIPFKQNAKVEYWEADGASLKKQMLKAPLKYSRISSKFSYARLHPIYKVYRPHLGVDYAAPSGTPVHSVADGVVTFRAYSGGGGNTIKIKHPGNIQTGYLHLSRFATGIKVGSHVSQGQLIGYVGSTGASTGPHLDYRVWKNGVAINPLTIPQEPTEPISDLNKAEFEYISSRIIAELNGDIEESEMITRIDTTYLTSPVADSVVIEAK
ncbi:MAG: peptidoglycan DD-metalloendopeptidase family protein [Rikenellaceae bacterium]